MKKSDHLWLKLASKWAADETTKPATSATNPTALHATTVTQSPTKQSAITNGPAVKKVSGLEKKGD
jgi:hypothetical protein